MTREEINNTAGPNAGAVNGENGPLKVAITLVRHGETESNRNQIIQGWLNTPLNELGEKQAAFTADRLESVPIVACFSSDLSRARKTAEIILSKKEKESVPLFLDQRLRESCLGDFEGKPLAEYRSAKNKDSIEPTETFKGRLLDFINDLPNLLNDNLPHLLSSSKPVQVLITTHGGVKRTLSNGLLERDIVTCKPESQAYEKINSAKSKNSPTLFPNCSVSTLDLEWDTYTIKPSSKDDSRGLKASDFVPSFTRGQFTLLGDDSHVPEDHKHVLTGDQNLLYIGHTPAKN